MQPSDRTKDKNQILAAIPAGEREDLFPGLRRITLPLRHVLYEAGAPFDYVYFIEEGLASVLTSMTEGSNIEVGMIAAEGIVGLPFLLGAETAAQQVVIQIPGTALRMNAAQCKATFDQSVDVRRVIHRFADHFMNLSAQTAGCNRLHQIEQRCARWLLMACDRVSSDTIPMTHEFLSHMLGVRRAGVSEVAGELQRSGLIRYNRGRLTITDREGLEAVACECYGVDRGRLERLLQ
jgi:CRP-like cAMP-binding protein